jgi:hypothetical protein
MNTERLHGANLQQKIANHKGWLIYPVRHSIAWTNTDTLIDYDGREYILSGLAQPITRIKKYELRQDISGRESVLPDTLMVE